MMQNAVVTSVVVLGCLSACLPSCGGAPAATAATPSVDSLGEQATCKVAKDPLNPMIVEWPGTNKVELATTSQHSVVVVSYVGCVLKVLSGCQAGGSYSMTSVTPVRDRIVVADENDLYARLPLGVASLKGELKTAGQLDLEYVAVGQRTANQAPANLTGECQGATHYVKAITVGAYSLDAVGHVSGSAGGSVGGNGVGGSRSEDVRRLRGSGNLGACAQADGSGCDAILQLGLAPLTGKPASDGDRLTVPAPQAARATPRFCGQYPNGGDKHYCYTSMEGCKSKDQYPSGPPTCSDYRRAGSLSMVCKKKYNGIYLCFMSRQSCIDDNELNVVDDCKLFE